MSPWPAVLSHGHAASTGGRRRPVILVVDNDRDTRELYRACFDLSGYTTAEASTGEEALALAIQLVPDILLTDLMLPDVDGLTLASRVKHDERTAAVHVILVTGPNCENLERRAIDAGVERAFFKPCLPQTMLREVERALRR